MRRLLVILAMAFAVAGCAEASAQVDAPEPQPDPQLVRGAEQVLASAPPGRPGWNTGVVVAEAKSKETSLFGEYDEWSIGVLTADESMTFLSGAWCDGYPKGSVEEREPNADKVLSVLLAPGDLITWDSKRTELCPSQVRVLRKAAAGTGAPQ